MEVTDEQILDTVNPSLMFNKRLQLAHDRMLLCPTGPESEEYADRWQKYLVAGGNRTMRDRGIDLNNWEHHRDKNTQRNKVVK